MLPISNLSRLACREELIDRLIQKHYAGAGRSFRYCHLRDLLMQVRGFCAYKGCEMELKSEYFDMAVANYFSIM
jgi:hypothetical protein